MSKVLVIVPAYNEAKRIKRVITELQREECIDGVVVVNDASQDDTAKLAKEAGAIVISHQENAGQGAAIETGHEYARQHQADYVIHFDGDGQFDPKDIEPALEYISYHRADILFGSRFLNDTTKLPWLKRHVILPLGRFFIDTLFFNISLSDSHNGFRILNKHALFTISITQNRMAHATQIPAQAKKYDLKMVEFPVTVEYHEYGQGIRGGFRIIKELVLGVFH